MKENSIKSHDKINNSNKGNKSNKSSSQSNFSKDQINDISNKKEVKMEN